MNAGNHACSHSCVQTDKDKRRYCGLSNQYSLLDQYIDQWNLEYKYFAGNMHDHFKNVSDTMFVVPKRRLYTTTSKCKDSQLKLFTCAHVQADDDGNG